MSSPGDDQRTISCKGCAKPGCKGPPKPPEEDGDGIRPVCFVTPRPPGGKGLASYLAGDAGRYDNLKS